MASVITVVLILGHTFLVNPARAVFIVACKIPEMLANEYHQFLLDEEEQCEEEEKRLQEMEAALAEALTLGSSSRRASIRNNREREDGNEDEDENENINVNEEQESEIQQFERLTRRRGRRFHEIGRVPRRLRSLPAQEQNIDQQEEEGFDHGLSSNANNRWNQGIGNNGRRGSILNIDSRRRSHGSINPNSDGRDHSSPNDPNSSGSRQSSRSVVSTTVVSEFRTTQPTTFLDYVFGHSNGDNSSSNSNTNSNNNHSHSHSHSNIITRNNTNTNNTHNNNTDTDNATTTTTITATDNNATTTNSHPQSNFDSNSNNSTQTASASVSASTSTIITPPQNNPNHHHHLPLLQLPPAPPPTTTTTTYLNSDSYHQYQAQPYSDSSSHNYSYPNFNSNSNSNQTDNFLSFFNPPASTRPSAPVSSRSLLPSAVMSSSTSGASGSNRQFPASTSTSTSTSTFATASNTNPNPFLATGTTTSSSSLPFSSRSGISESAPTNLGQTSQNYNSATRNFASSLTASAAYAAHDAITRNAISSSIEGIPYPPISYTKEQWERRLVDFPVSKAELNSLIMNYLIVEGYQDAALKFAQEANVPIASSTSLATNSSLGFGQINYNNLQSSTSSNTKDSKKNSGLNSFNYFDFTGSSNNNNSNKNNSNETNSSNNTPSLYYHQQPPIFSINFVRERMLIKNLILIGCIQQAIEKINDVDPELLDTHSALHFSLLRLQLIELIRNANNKRLALKRKREMGEGTDAFSNKEQQSTDGSPSSVEINDIALIQPALDFAASHLARRAPANPKFLEYLEQTMALLCFPPDKLVPQLEELMDPKLRKKVADDVNALLLARQGIAGESNIQALTRLWGWGEQELAEGEGVNFPILNLSSLM